MNSNRNNSPAPLWFSQLLLIFSGTLLWQTPVAEAFEVGTHRLINEKAASTDRPDFSLDGFLTKQLGFENGIDQKLLDREVRKLIGDGGVFEDNGFRYLHHFHNPLKPWDAAGFKGLFSASILWGQTPIGTQSLFGDWSWHDARDYYYRALTAGTAAAREQYFAKTFRAIGQVMHLAEDASVPGHVRNDAHVFYSYEKWVKAEQAKRDAADQSLLNRFLEAPVSPAPSIFELPPNPLAPVPIAKLLDTDQYDGTNPDVTVGPAIGIAEYVNANFFSEDTIGSGFPYPRLGTTETTLPYTYHGDTFNRRYHLKVGEGETNGGFGYVLAAVDWLEYYRRQDPARYADNPDTQPMPTFDSNVYDSYAQLLIPRALGYAASTLHYFFRGNIEITPPDRFVYGITTADGSFTEIRLKARNVTTTGEPLSNGAIKLVLTYRQALEDPYRANLGGPVPTSAEATTIVVPVANGVTSIPSDVPVELVFNLPSDAGLPRLITDLHAQVVYRGAWGDEADAVVVGYKDLSEPTPVDVINMMDYVCLNGQFLVAGSAEAVAVGDLDHDGSFAPDEPDVFRHGLQNVFVRFSSVESPVPASDADYTVRMKSLSPTATVAIQPAEYGRVVVLVEPDFSFSSRIQYVREDTRDPSTHPGTRTFTVPMRAVKNQREVVNGQDITFFSVLSEVRALPVWFGVPYFNAVYPTGTSCADSAIRGATPALTGPVSLEFP